MIQTQGAAGELELAQYKPLDNVELAARIEAARVTLGDELLILGHHYQQDEVIAHADLRGDSYQLSEEAAASTRCRWIVFCGVHFMAETADILANRPAKLVERNQLRVQVVLPDMAAIEQVEDAWDQMGEVLDLKLIIPVTYINSAASLKAFCGQHNGIVCTSSNAEAVLKWAFERGSKVLFFPDQHLGRNTARRMGISNDLMPVWNPFEDEFGGNSEKGIAVCTRCSRPLTCFNFERLIRESKCWFIQNVRKRSWICPTLTARLARSSRLFGRQNPVRNGRLEPSCTWSTV